MGSRLRGGASMVEAAGIFALLVRCAARGRANSTVLLLRNLSDGALVRVARVILGNAGWRGTSWCARASPDVAAIAEQPLDRKQPYGAAFCHAHDSIRERHEKHLELR